MNELQVALEKLLSAALAYSSGRIYREAMPPGAYDDAQAELELEMVDEAVTEYVRLRDA